MATVKFRLKEPNSESETLIYLYFHFDYYETNGEGKKRYLPLKYSTGERILPKFWNNSKDKQRAKNSKDFRENGEFNKRLDDLETDIKNIYRRLINNKVSPTPDMLRVELDKVLHKTQDSKTPSFFEFVEDLITNSSKSFHTRRNYRTSLNHLLTFQKTYPKKIDFDSIDLDFYDSLTNYFNGNKKSLNTLGSIIKNIKVFLNEAAERGIQIKEDYKSKKFKTLSETSESIYLSIDEIMQIYNLDLKKNKRLERVRDLFIIGCFTGLRFSDFSKLKSENITENKDGLFIRIRTTKTNETLVIPLHQYVKEILTKYKDNIPPPISNQKMNDYLKEIGEKAKLTEEILISQTIGNKKQSEVFKKYDLITTHTARRSFATNLYKSGIPSISIMKITGHRTERNFLKYIKVSAEENAVKLSNSSFFTVNNQPLQNEKEIIEN